MLRISGRGVCMANRRANAVVFAWDFQVNASIVLMLENIEDLSSVRIESDNEDIDITLNDGTHILAQAKSVEKSSSDFSHVLSNLEKSLLTLSEGASKVNCDKLIYITNTPNPLKDDILRNIFTENAHRDYDSLPQPGKDIVDKYIDKLGIDIDLEKLSIQILPFETDNQQERYKYVYKAVDDFVGRLQISRPGFISQLLSCWQQDVFFNGSQKDLSLKLSKKDLIWPAIMIVIDIERYPSSFSERFDDGLYDEIVYQYHEAIRTCCERFELITKVLYDYNSYCKNNRSNSIEEFALTQWKNYIDDFNLKDVNEEIQSGFIQIVLYNIIKNRFVVDKIKSGVNL